MTAKTGYTEPILTVGIGASAGGLGACSRLLDAMPAGYGMAFVLVQHLDPTHESMLVNLLAGHTSMAVCQAADEMPIEADHVYVIPPGAYLSIAGHTLHLSQPLERHGARLPFDFLLQSLAEEFGARAACVVLSGTGADGSQGLKAVKHECGLVIAQDPDEADFDGMPRSAIMTGAVDLVLPVGEIPQALVSYGKRTARARALDNVRPHGGAPDWLPAVIELLRAKTDHDFTLYKPGTLRRRIERRMAMAAIDIEDSDRYLDVLRGDDRELEQLAKDLLIHVTGFFRDPDVFDLLAENTIPAMVRGQSLGQPLRIWIAGCSTGEETYSLVMLFLEAIAADGRDIKLQIFASDVDPDAVASARDGLYPESIEADISPVRLARFFTKEERGYRVLPELRTAVIFAVQDVLADPPFSNLNFISCRNLLIYLSPEAQDRIISLFHFALRADGILLLGNAETVGTSDGRFKVVSMPARLYRHAGHSRPGELGLAIGAGGMRVSVPQGQDKTARRQAARAELCRRLVLDDFAPAAVLINRFGECLFSLGPTDRYLRVAPGDPSHDLLAMARHGLRSRLRAAINRAGQENARVVMTGGRVKQGGDAAAISIDVRPLQDDGEELLLVCFVDAPKGAEQRPRPESSGDVRDVAELERELQATQAELMGAIHDLEISSAEQKAINEEALSVNEEFQSTNEELMTSKEELQSLNEELTALNNQLQETLERQSNLSNDLENILYSTDVATVFLDINLNIRFFTPATRSLFSVIDSDIGRPLADLRSLAVDSDLLDDARAVLQSRAPIEREIEAHSGAWYVRRVLPYQTKENGAGGVVITFTDISERKHAAESLEAARRQAEVANMAKSRFLAAASHDLRQPLQTLSLLQGILAKTVTGDKARDLVVRLDQTLAAMSNMLNAVLDINQIDAGAIRPEMRIFPVKGLLARLQDEFNYHAQAQGLTFRVVPCGLSIDSDPGLLEQVLRNLLSNALKYTRRGKVLLGCRRHGDKLSIEIWDTGIGIPESELEAIFEEYHRVHSSDRGEGGLGLGLSIVHRLAKLLGHRVSVRSRLGEWSVFGVEVSLAPAGGQARHERDPVAMDDTVAGDRRAGVILVVEDDAEVNQLLTILLENEGHEVVSAPDGGKALDLMRSAAVQPDLLLTDYNLPNGLSGLDVAVQLRNHLGHIPVIILTGDISAETLGKIAPLDCVQINKPVRTGELARVVQRLLADARSPAQLRPSPTDVAEGVPPVTVIYVVDDDAHVREGMRAALEGDGRTVESFANCEAFLEAYRPGGDACLVLDAYLPGMSGISLLQRLDGAVHRLPVIMITGSGDIATAVQAMKTGASDFLQKPVDSGELLTCVQRALDQARDESQASAWRSVAADRIARLTPRQREVMELVLAGRPNKIIATHLDISQRTVETHRAAVMKKTGAKSLPELARLALAANSHLADRHG